jgi:hypothetical protein
VIDTDKLSVFFLFLHCTADLCGLKAHYFPDCGIFFADISRTPYSGDRLIATSLPTHNNRNIEICRHGICVLFSTARTLRSLVRTHVGARKHVRICISSVFAFSCGVRGMLWGDRSSWSPTKYVTTSRFQKLIFNKIN